MSITKMEMWDLTKPTTWVSMAFIPIMPAALTEGGRFRWCNLFSITSLVVCGVWPNSLKKINHKELAAKVNFAQGFIIAFAPYVNFLIVDRFFPRKVTSIVGAALMTSALYDYMKLEEWKNDLPGED